LDDIGVGAGTGGHCSIVDVLNRFNLTDELETMIYQQYGQSERRWVGYHSVEEVEASSDLDAAEQHGNTNNDGICKKDKKTV